MKMNRRDLIRKTAIGTAAIAAFPVLGCSSRNATQAVENIEKKRALKISLNAYSFNTPLRDGSMTLDDLLNFCADTGFDGVDITGYYFPGYPAVPSDELIYHVKRKAFRLGIELGCIGVRNDFTWADPLKRAADIQLVKDWVVAAHKLGAPGLRIFSGNQPAADVSWDQMADQVAADIRECAGFAADRGVMLALQNHNDFLKTSADVDKLMEKIGHEWVGLMLDIGSYRTPDPYVDISANVRHAITWQIKQNVYVNDTQTATDLLRLMQIIDDSGYRGYLPLETLGEGDPYTKVKAFYEEVRNAVAS
jgi:sugar phosphate isomerase/epimerase